MAATSASDRRVKSLVRHTRRLRDEVDALHFGPPVTHVYNPLLYAGAGYERYLARYARTRKEVVFLGMNPGPYGMAQTGVPFGEVEHVRTWLGIETPVGRPAREHPRRPIQGFACARSEVSGRRLWGTIAAHFGSPSRFFARHFVANYCPLLFLEESGRNRTPDKLAARERDALYEICNRHLARLVDVLEPEWLIGVGAFAEARAREALAATGVRIGNVLHPSPANPKANRDWSGTVEAQLTALGLCGGDDRARE